MLRRKSSRYPTPAQKREREQWADCHGIPFDEYRLWLPEKCSDWRQVVRVKNDSVERLMHEWHWTCWNLDAWHPAYSKVEAHHIAAGTKGRADEFTNIAMFCAECHSNVNTDRLPMGRVLYLKWKHDRAHVDWVRLALLHRKHLPDLITN